jgi:hypothetical protein
VARLGGELQGHRRESLEENAAQGIKVDVRDFAEEAKAKAEAEAERAEKERELEKERAAKK